VFVVIRTTNLENSTAAADCGILCRNIHADNMISLPETAGRKLRLFQMHDPLKHWWSLSEMRFCAKCEHLFTGNDIRVTLDDHEQVQFRCPTPKCPGQWKDWQYPNLHL
jgi:hypothetical protein